MKSSVRNQLALLLLNAFHESKECLALEWLALLCKLVGRRKSPKVRLLELLERKGLTRINKGVRSALEQLLGDGKFFQLRRIDDGGAASGGLPKRLEGNLWLIEPHPEVYAALTAVRERARIYVRLLGHIKEINAAQDPQDPLRRAMAQAALCFNAGLFFETHEHLEHYWMAEPAGPVKRFLQGIIQISVGFHHARLGKYDGAINQLAKGLEKTLGATGNFLGLNCNEFLPKVVAAREAILRRGRAQMTPLSLSKIPRMRLKK